MRIENPYIQGVWIAAISSELKVANPDNIYSASDYAGIKGLLDVIVEK